MLANNSIDSLISGVLMHGPEIINNCITTEDVVMQYLERIDQECLQYPRINSTIDNKWLIPNSYKEFDVKSFCLNLTTSQVEYNRVMQEFELFEQHNMVVLLQTIKFIVDTLRQHNVVWGVGRGSSVASYILFLLGIHKINPLKYDIPITEFFK